MCWHQKVFVQMFQFLLNCHPSSKYTLRWWHLFFCSQSILQNISFSLFKMVSKAISISIFVWFEIISQYVFSPLICFEELLFSFWQNIWQIWISFFFHWGYVMFFKIFYLYCKMSLTFSVMNYTSLLYFAEFIIEPLRKHKQYSTQLHNGREIIK